MATRLQVALVLVIGMTSPTPLFALDADQVNAAQPPTTTHASVKPDSFSSKRKQACSSC
jgi:hypothetical protein